MPLTIFLGPHSGGILFGKDRGRVVVSPDVGSVSRARYFADRMDLPLQLSIRRPKANVAEVVNAIGIYGARTSYS